MTLPLKTKDISVNLSTLTWGTDSLGKYYTTVPTGISSGEQIAISKKTGWNKYPVNVVVEPYINTDDVGIIGLLSTTNSFDANNKLSLRLLYV